MIATSLRAIQGHGAVLAVCPACRSGNTSRVLNPSGSTGPIYGCADCGSRYFRTAFGDCLLEGEETDVESFGTESAIYWQGQVSWLTRLLGYEPGHVLDIGCMTGDFLLSWPKDVLKEGIEPDEDKAVAAWERGVRLFDGGAQSAFDVVTCYDVLNRSAYSERIFDLFPALTVAGGIIAIQIPTYESHRAYLNEPSSKVWTLYRDGARTTYFSRKYLHSKFEKLGFERIAESWNSGPLEEEGESSTVGLHPLFDRYCVVFRKQ